MSKKIFLIGDSHIGLGYPNTTDKWHKVHIEYFRDFLIPLLKREVKEGDIIVHLGDLFDNRNIIPINILNYGMDIVEEISKIAPLHIIIGNHDLYSKSASEINSIRPFKYIPNVEIYSSPRILNYNNLNILMMPYIEKRVEQIKVIEDNKNCDYLFCHSDLNGCKMHLNSVAHRNHDKIDIENFKSFRKVRSGHIHLVQTNNNFTFVGSIFQMDRNDIGDQKGIFVIDTENDTEEFFPNNVSPIFKKFRVVDEESIDELDTLKESKDYIDLAISNSLLVSNRKLRRKLETLLENGKFASVEYIDDISKSDVEDDENIVESVLTEDGTKIDISIQLDYEKYIREYIEKRSYDNNDYKDGVLSEFDEIIRLYNENYKSKVD
jgi:calcineurin-like phosphoesterase family protein